MAMGMSPKERIAFFKKKQEEEAQKNSEQKVAPKKIGKLDKFDKKPQEEEKKEVKKVVIKKKKKTINPEETATSAVDSQKKEKDKEIKNEKVVSQPLEKPKQTEKSSDLEKKEKTEVTMDEQNGVSIDGELAVNTSLAEGITSPELTSPNIIEGDKQIDEPKEVTEVITEELVQKEVTEVITVEIVPEVEQSPPNIIEAPTEPLPVTQEEELKEESVNKIKEETVTEVKEEPAAEDLVTEQPQANISTEEIPKESAEIAVAENVEPVTEIVSEEALPTEPPKEAADVSATEPSVEESTLPVEEVTKPAEIVPEPEPEVIEEQKNFIIQKYAGLEDDIYNTLFYFSGMGTLIGESVASGIYVNDLTSKRGLSLEFLEEETRKKRIGGEKIAHLVHNARTQATDLTSGLKNLQHLLDSLPTFGDVVDVNVMKPDPITPLEGEGPPLTSEETKPVSEIFEEAHKKRVNELNEIEQKKSEVISKNISEQYATMQSSYEADAKLTPVHRRVREVDNKNNIQPPIPQEPLFQPVQPSITPKALISAPKPIEKPAPVVNRQVQHKLPPNALSAGQQYRLAVEATEKAAAKHSPTPNLPSTDTYISRAPLKPLDASQNITIASHNPRISPAKEIMENYFPQNPSNSIPSTQPLGQSSFINYQNIKPTIPIVAPKLELQGKKPAAPLPENVNSQYGVFDPSCTLAKSRLSQEKENSRKNSNPIPVYAPAPMTNGINATPVKQIPSNPPSYDKPVRNITKPKPFQGGYMSGDDGDLKPWQLSKLRAAEVYMINKKLEKEGPSKPGKQMPNYNQQAKPFAPNPPEIPAPKRTNPKQQPSKQPPPQQPSQKPYIRYDAFDNPLTQLGFSDV